MKPYGRTLNLDCKRGGKFPDFSMLPPFNFCQARSRFLYFHWNRVCGKALGFQMYLPKEGINEVVMAIELLVDRMLTK